ncbi:hypothetical protein HPP92_010392 [Vanilla planifolia]|uniref:MIR domain-containing protein n=1 Tax=Vanilla planifolia TaxID=51239 RepID=A0A835R013_VANPL|nr:hypothetical protein HPP92_010392 [Vanilla planifolia]
MECLLLASAAIALLLLGLIPAGVSNADDNGIEIAYGSVIKLMHERTKFRLHSHDILYGSGSGQQSVTGYPDVDDASSYWIVKPQLDSSAKQGDAIPSGSIIRLQHMTTRRWLHSHVYASPISGNLEVSCFGGDDESNTGDHWQLDIEGNGTWKRNQRIKLRHIDTGAYLHSHKHRYKGSVEGSRRYTKFWMPKSQFVNFKVHIPIIK